MGLIALIAGSSALLIKAYRWLKSTPGEGSAVLNSIKQQAAVIGTFANAVFSVLEALSAFKIATARPITVEARPTPRYGAPGGMSIALSRFESPVIA